VDQGCVSDTESDEYFDADTYFDIDELITSKPKSIIDVEVEAHQTMKLLLQQLEENSKSLDTSIKQLETIQPDTMISSTTYLILLSWPIIGVSLYHFLWNRK